MALAGGLIGSLLACIGVTPVLNILEDTFVLPTGMWTLTLALKGAGVGIVTALLLGSWASIYPAWKSAGLDPQEAITRGALE